MQALLLSALLFAPLAAIADVDPETDPRARALLLALPGVQDQIRWARGQNFNGSVFAEFRITTRAGEVPAGYDPSTHFAASHYLMFLSNDWKWLCQVSLRALWRTGDGLALEEKESGEEAKPYCFPRI